jgi:hypothetical protein
MSDTRSHDPQPSPTEGDGPPVIVMVISDLWDRADLGYRKYGVALRAGNGRDALLDAYAEALDLCCYLKQALMERDAS